MSKLAQEETRLEVEIHAAHKLNRQIYDPERLQYDLTKHGVYIGISRVKRIRKKLGIKYKQKKKFKVTTDSNHTHAVAKNLLN